MVLHRDLKVPMEEQERREKAEQYRDPQIDDLIEELRVLASDVWDLRWAVRYGADQNSSAAYSIARDLSQAIYALGHTLERTAFVPWYVRLARWLRSKRGNLEMRKLEAEHKRKESERREHMQRLAENAGKLNYGRFRSRYS